MTEEKNPILTVRLPDGSIQPIMALQGTSAYEMARAQGYGGTEAQFGEALARVTGAFDWVWNGGTSSGPSPILYFGQNEYSFSPIPSASSTASGIVTTTAQSFAGEKTFQSDVILNKSNIHIIDTEQNNGKAFRISSAKIHEDSGKNYSIGLHMGSGQENRGLYDFTSDEWITYSDKDNNVRVQGKAKSVSWHKGRDGALICMDVADNQYRPALSIRTYEWEATEKDANGNDVTVLHGGDWAFGNYQDENLKLTFASTTNYKANKNNTIQFTFASNGGFTVPGALSVGGASTLKALSATTGTFSSTLTATGKITGNGGLATTTISASGASTLKAVSATTGTFSSTITATGKITGGSFESAGNYVTTASNRGFKAFNTGKTYSIKLHMGNGGENRGLYDGEDASKGLKDWALYWDKSNNALINAKDRFTPDKAGIYLGDSDYRWKNIYTLNLNNSGSDIRNKIVQDDIILKKLLLVYDSVVPIAYKWKNSELGNSTHDRVHIGLSAQEVEEKMYENKLTRMDFGGLCVDPVYETDENGDKTDKIIDEQYSLRYGEFHGLHILKNQQQDIRIKDLEEKNQQLENTIAELKTQLELIKLAIGG